MAHTWGSSTCSSLTLYLHCFVLSSLFLIPNTLFSLLSLHWLSTPLLFLLCQCMGLFPSILPHLPFCIHLLWLAPHIPFPPPSPFTLYIHIFFLPCSLLLSFILFLCHLSVPSLSFPLCFPVLFFPDAISIIGRFSAHFPLSLSLFPSSLP